VLASLGPRAAGAGTLSEYRLLALDGHQLKWGTPLLGSGAVVSYALVDREWHFRGARNCSRLGPIEPTLAANNVPAADFQAELVRAFDAWRAVAGITFEPGDPRTADILIGAQIVPRGRAFTNVSYNEATSAPGVRSLTKALICLNPTVPWKIGFDGDLEVYDLRYTLMHEIGHAIGLNHPEADGELMHFSYSETFRTPQEGDVRGVVTLYGRAAIPPVLVQTPAPPPRKAKDGWGEAAFRPQTTPAVDVRSQ
jgi:hypothetical protein